MIRQGAERSDAFQFDDEMLRAMYVEYNAPCDSLVSDPAKLQSFAEDYADRTGQHVQAAEVSHRLLALRKLGEAKGGLPRLRRNYRAQN